MDCPFCETPVEEELWSVVGCQECIESWQTNMHVDHPVD